MSGHAHFAAQIAPCWTCSHFGGWAEIGIWCVNPKSAGPLGGLVVSQAEHGCSSWTRAVGADDVPLTGRPKLGVREALLNPLPSPDGRSR